MLQLRLKRLSTWYQHKIGNAHDFFSRFAIIDSSHFYFTLFQCIANYFSQLPSFRNRIARYNVPLLFVIYIILCLASWEASSFHSFPRPSNSNGSVRGIPLINSFWYYKKFGQAREKLFEYSGECMFLGSHNFWTIQLPYFLKNLVVQI